MKTKKQKNIDYVLKLTETCKTWGGPCCSVEELKSPDEKPRQSEEDNHTHKGDRLGRPELFKLSNIDTTIMLENLFILLTNKDNRASRSSVLKILSDDSKNAADHPVFEVNELCVGPCQCWSVPVLVRASVGPCQCWSVPVLVCASVGPCQCWSVPVLVRASVGPCQCWSVPVLVRASVGPCQ